MLKQAEQGSGAGRAGRTGGAGRQNGRARHFAIRVHHSKTMADLLPKRLHLNTFPSRSGSIHFGSPPKLVRWPFATFLFVPNGCSKHQTCTFRSKQSRAEQQRRHGRQGGRTEQFCLLSSRNAHFEASRAGRRRRRQGRQSRQDGRQNRQASNRGQRWDATGQVKCMKALGAQTTIFAVLGGSQRSNHCKRSAWELLALKPLYS